MISNLEAKKYYDELVENRRYLHEHPEIGFDLPNTSKYVIQKLIEYGITNIQRVSKSSVVATIKNGQGSVFGLRADMDALPMKEENDTISYCSKNESMMHACGHDVHTSILLSSAHYLANHLDQWKGTVKLIFQEAEEGPFPGGAHEIVKSGVVDDVNVFFGLHCSPEYEVGTFAIKMNEALASADTFSATIIGKGAHAAYPHLGIDPVLMQAEIIQAIHCIPSRQINPTDNCVVSVTQVHSGTTHNIIPESAFFEGTVRTFTNTVRDKIEQEIENVIKSITSRYQAKYRFSYSRGYDSLINQPYPTMYLKDTIVKTFGEQAMISLNKPSMGAEDFSKYINHKTGAFVWLGTGSSPETKYGLHHPKFNINEEAMLYGTIMMINLVLNGLNYKENE